MQRLIILLFTSFFLPVAMHAQSSLIYNINQYNGLSSDHIYCTHVDHLGYLWLGTNKGVYRYNGYALKKYDYSNGLGTIDIWGLYEDRSNKIWLRGISNQFGYIKNGVYKSVYINNKSETAEIYPLNIFEYNNAIYILEQKHADSVIIIQVKNDTLSRKNIPAQRISDYYAPVIIIDSFFVQIYTDSIFVYRSDILQIQKIKKRLLNIVPLQSEVLGNRKIHQQIRDVHANKYYTYSSPKDTAVYFYDIGLNKENKFILPDNERLVYAHGRTNMYYIITDKSIYYIDSILRYTSLKITDLYPPSSKNIAPTHFTTNKLWGKILATDNSGVFLNYGTTIFKRDEKLPTGYSYVGQADSTAGYWWKESEQKLIKIENGVISNTYYLPNVKRLLKAKSTSGSEIFITTLTRAYWLNSTTGKIRNVADKITATDFRAIIKGCESCDTSLPFYVKDFDFYHKDTIYYCAHYWGLMSMIYDNRRVTINGVYNERHRNVSYNSSAGILVAYSVDKAVLINLRQKDTLHIAQEDLRSAGIFGIEKIVIDDYGNIYIKDYNKLWLYNSKKIVQLLPNYILNDAKIEICGNTIAVAGTHGITTLTAKGTGKVETTAVYPNTKELLYNSIVHLQFTVHDILISTDKGYYRITKSDSTINTIRPTYSIVATIDSIQTILKDNDTLTLKPTSTSFDIDFIKPTGTGVLNIEYAINNGTFQNTGAKIILPKTYNTLYYNVSVQAYDNNWKSQPINFTIYIQPLWWQTSTAKRWSIIGGILLLVTIGYVTFIFTRYLVNKNNDRRNQRRELELKSIYSQINPHFIFNSLSTALYFVRKNKNKEAFEHISQFSQLLRAYIKSSRNKYISISEEIGNLKNYLELQLTRFEDKFDYIFDVAAEINPNSTKIPSLLLQPLVENALNHGIFHLSEKSTLKISFTIQGDYLICKVDDNGIGRKKSKEIRSEIIRKADSYGSILIEELVNTFNKYEKITISIEYIDKVAPETGTTAVVTIKNFNLV